ncbi:MAG: V-type ATP synthase subunit A [Nanobdellota archaeon]
MNGTITKISGPVIEANNMSKTKMYNLVRVGSLQLLGEVIQLKGDTAVIQVYEDTSGLAPGEKVLDTNQPLSITLGPGLVGNIYDGIGRPLHSLAESSGDFISRGITTTSLDTEKKYSFTPSLKKGDVVSEGMVLGTVKETSSIIHKILVPAGVSGTIYSIKKASLTVTDPVAIIKDDKKKYEVSLSQKSPVRKPRSFSKRFLPKDRLVTGRRVIDTFFPIAKGGTAAIPGPFGAGKTMTQQDIAKWCDADVIVYIGCGERGNEMTEVLTEFPDLKDPRSGKPLIDRTIMIANTSNMPVAAREASIYTGITIAEYYRDQGYDVALMADSTSRWAEAMREISTRLEEMPREEGYPAYLPERLAHFYERAGLVKTHNDEYGSVTVIGAISPQGGDFSEPVTHNTLRVVKTFWALDSSLAYKRHFPAINWIESYSGYVSILDHSLSKQSSSQKSTSESLFDLQKKALYILQEEDELQEIVKLVGPDALSEDKKAIMQTAKILREDFLQQNSLDPVDAFCSKEKQHSMLGLILDLHKIILKGIDDGISIKEIISHDVFSKIAELKTTKDISSLSSSIKKKINDLDSSFETKKGEHSD